MTTKLTLSIEKKTVERAKLLSARAGKSISKIVEEYLNELSGTAAIENSVVDKLSGSLKKAAPQNIQWKEVKANYLKKKYGL
jgi:uncharacterized protein DUF6364